jgi:hypothetical protein
VANRLHRSSELGPEDLHPGRGSPVRSRTKKGLPARNPQSVRFTVVTCTLTSTWLSLGSACPPRRSGPRAADHSWCGLLPSWVNCSDNPKVGASADQGGSACPVRSGRPRSRVMVGATGCHRNHEAMRERRTLSILKRTTDPLTASLASLVLLRSGGLTARGWAAPEVCLPRTSLPSRRCCACAIPRRQLRPRRATRRFLPGGLLPGSPTPRHSQPDQANAVRRSHQSQGPTSADDFTPLSALAITDEASPFALLSTRIVRGEPCTRVH